MERKTVLIVDDAADVRKLLKFHLGKKYDVHEASDGAEGLSMIEKVYPDLLILDINMPKVDGIAVYKKISAGTGRPPFPVIILTVREELGALFKDLNVDGFVTKPFNMDFVLKEIDTIMAKRYGGAVKEEARPVRGPVKILIVEDDPAAFNKIIVTFLNAGYAVETARKGLETIEKLMIDLPQVILIKLGLSDLSGDLVAAKLKQMPRTMGIPCVLYTPHGSTIDRVVVSKLCEIAHTHLVESDDPVVLLKEIEKALQRKEILEKEQHDA